MSQYQWNAADYELHSQAQQHWASELIDKLQLLGTESVLDVGCGDGKVTVELANQVSTGSVTGIDSSPDMIALAKRRHPSSRYPNLTFQIMDAAALSYGERFDIVFSNAALHWVKDHQPVLEGIFSSLKPGGRILLQMGGKGNAGEILSVVEELQSHPHWRQYFTDFNSPYGFYGVEEYEALLSRAGFEISRVTLIPKDMTHSGRSGLLGWIRTTWLPYTQRVPEQQRDKFIDDIATQYLARIPIDEGGLVHVAMVRIEVEARKPG